MLTIGQVASKAGLRASAIRYYEAEGLLPPASRHGGKRVYDASILDRLAMIALAKQAGFEIAEIRALLSAGRKQPAQIWSKLGQAKRAELDRETSRLRRIEYALAKLNECACATLEECGRRFNEARLQPPLNLVLDATALRQTSKKPLTRRRSAATR